MNLERANKKASLARLHSIMSQIIRSCLIIQMQVSGGVLPFVLMINKPEKRFQKRKE